MGLGGLGVDQFWREWEPQRCPPHLTPPHLSPPHPTHSTPPHSTPLQPTPPRPQPQPHPPPHQTTHHAPPYHTPPHHTPHHVSRSPSQRFHVLSNREFAWYQNEEAHAAGSPPKGFVRLAGSTPSAIQPVGGSSRFGLRIHPPSVKVESAPVLDPSLERVGRVLLLEAVSEEERDVWLRALEGVAT